MFIDKEKWNKLIESFSKVYSNYDYFSDNMKDLIEIRWHGRGTSAC